MIYKSQIENICEGSFRTRHYMYRILLITFVNKVNFRFKKSDFYLESFRNNSAYSLILSACKKWHFKIFTDIE